MRQSRALSSAGRVFVVRGWTDGFGGARGIVMVNLPDLLEGVVDTEPMMEAQMLESYTWVPGPARWVVAEPSTSPGSATGMGDML